MGRLDCRFMLVLNEGCFIFPLLACPSFVASYPAYANKSQIRPSTPEESYTRGTIPGHSHSICRRHRRRFSRRTRYLWLLRIQRCGLHSPLLSVILTYHLPQLLQSTSPAIWPSSSAPATFSATASLPDSSRRAWPRGLWNYTVVKRRWRR